MLFMVGNLELRESSLKCGNRFPSEDAYRPVFLECCLMLSILATTNSPGMGLNLVIDNYDVASFKFWPIESPIILEQR